MLQVDMKTLDAIILVKTLGKAFEKVKGLGVPLIWVSPSTALDPTYMRAYSPP